jgi:beta-xylosidase
MVGVNGKGVVTFRKPDVEKTYPVTTLPTSDEFSDTTLGMQWGWNHNPDTTKWSLTQRKGYLRLTTGKAVSSLREARNTLTQRMFTYYSDGTPTIGVTKIEVANMKDGDVAGLAVFQDPFAFIAIKRLKGIKHIFMMNNGMEIDARVFKGNTVYLRASASYDTGKATFSCSTDNKNFTTIGNEFEMKFNLSVFTGNKFGLFNYATKTPGGYVDFDWFRMHPLK